MYGFTMQGIDSIVQFITAHKVQVTQEDLSLILHETNPLTTSLSEVAQQAIGSLGMYVMSCSTTIELSDYFVYVHV